MGLEWWNLYLFVAFSAAAAALAMTPACRALAVTLDFQDKPKTQGHKLHGKATPLLGGLAMLSAWIFTIAMGYVSVPFVQGVGDLSGLLSASYTGMEQVSPRVAIIAGAIVLATLLGLIDDKWPMSAKVKFLGQFTVAAIFPTWGGVNISLFINSDVISWLITVFWFLLVMNAINFFDNMDGLAVGIGAIAFALFAVAAASRGQHFVACLSAAGLGSCVGFWFYNHSPATIFMGDSGSHFLGCNLALVGVLTTFYDASTHASPLSVLIPAFILAIPLFDALAVTVIRLKAGKPIYIGDHNHISHRFLRMGMDRKTAVFCVHLLALAIGLGVLPLMWGDGLTTIVCCLQASVMLALVTLLQHVARKPQV